MRERLDAADTGRMMIRLAIDDDIREMQRVRAGVRENRLSDPASVQDYHVRAMLRSGRGWVCEFDGRVVGFTVADLEGASIWALFVDPAFERQGIGRRLHQAAVEWLFAAGVVRITLTTDPGTRAERFYQSAGWRYVGPAGKGEVRYELIASRDGSGR